MVDGRMMARVAVLGCLVAVVTAGAACDGACTDNEDKWDYGLDPYDSTGSSSGHNCGGTSEQTSSSYDMARCGQNNWAHVCPFCATEADGGSAKLTDLKGQSPVDVDTTHLYKPHGIDELRFKIKDNGTACTTADVIQTPRTWRIPFTHDGPCYNAVELDFKYDQDHIINFKKMYATKIEFRYPAEHTVDGTAASMEMQISFSYSKYVKNAQTAAAAKKKKNNNKGPSSGSANPYDDYNSDVPTKLVIAVLMEANSAYGDHPFLDNIWKRAKNETSGSWAPGELNFADNFLPSEGLSFPYYYYKGSLTTPPCLQCDEAVKWVVMKKKAKMSVAQLDYYVDWIYHKSHTLANLKKYGYYPYNYSGYNSSSSYKKDHSDLHQEFGMAMTKGASSSSCRKGASGGGCVPAPIYNSTARQTQPLGPRHVYEFKDEVCYVRSCHKIFETKGYLNTTDAIICLAFLIGATIAIELTLHHLEHKFHHHRTASKMQEKVVAELAILGFVSFIVFVIKASCLVSIGGEDDIIQNHHYLGFEVAHILIFVVAMYYVAFNSVVLFVTELFARRLDKMLNLSGEKLHSFLDSAYTGYDRGIASTLLGRSKLIDWGFVYCAYEFMIRHDLSKEKFDYLKYLRYYLSHSITESMDISVWTWSFCFVFCMAIWYSSGEKDKVGVFVVWGWASMVVLAVAMVGARFSFQRLIHAHGIESLEDVKAKVKDHEMSDNKAEKRKSNAKFKRKTLSESKATDEDAQTSKSGTDAMETAIENGKMLQAIWFPCGHIGVMQFLSESAAMITCFYAGMYTIQFRNVELETSEQILVIVPIVVICCFLTPALMLIKTMVASITHPSPQLIGEVTEFMMGNVEMRKTLMDTLFPKMDETLMEKVSSDTVVSIFRHFDDDLSFSIEPKEFATGCRALDLHLSATDTKRLLRLLDEDRSGDIDPYEVVALCYAEKLERLDARIKHLFQKMSEPEHPDQIKVDRAAELVKAMYGPGRKVPASTLELTKAKLQGATLFPASVFKDMIVVPIMGQLKKNGTDEMKAAMDKAKIEGGKKKSLFSPRKHPNSDKSADTVSFSVLKGQGKDKADVAL